MLGFKRSMVQLVISLVWFTQHWTFGSSVLWSVFAGLSVLSAVYAILTYDHDYWFNRGVFSPPAWPLVGHIKSVVSFKEQGGMCFKRIYDTYPDLKILGTHQFFQRTLVVRDPALIRRICVTDFQHFVDRGFFFNKDVDPLAGSVLFLRGNEWRKLRTKISPIFSPNKLRGMLPLIENTASEFTMRVTNLLTSNKQANHTKLEKLDNSKDIAEDNTEDVTRNNNNNKEDIARNNIENTTTDNAKEIDLDNEEDTTEENKENKPMSSNVVNSEKLVGGYTADAIVPCAFGLKSNVMDNENDPFAVALQAFYEISFYNVFEKTMRQFWPAFALFFRMRIIPRKTHDFFYNIVTSVLRARERGEQEKRGDFIDMMMALRSEDRNNNKINSSADEEDVEITDMVISANAFIIFLGGFETTSSTLAFLLLELAAHHHVQEKLRKEIIQVLERHEGQATYEALQELSYMEMVIQETLRLYPPFPSIQRLCTKNYRIPDTDTTIEKGTVVLFPTLGIQRDNQYFENADSFIPERWADGSPAPPPGVYMPFGDGPRYCIGKRFALIQMKCCLVRLVPRVRITPAPSAPPRGGPFTADPRSPLTLHPLDSSVTFSAL